MTAGGGGGFWQIMTHDRGVKKISARLRAENFLPLLCVVIKCVDNKCIYWVDSCTHKTAFLLNNKARRKNDR